MGDLIKASSRFKRHAARTQSYTIAKLDEYDGYLLIKLRKYGMPRTSMMASIPLEVFPNHGLGEGDIIRLECTGRLFTPRSKFAPHIILKSFEKIGGEVVDEYNEEQTHGDRLLCELIRNNPL